MKILKSDKKSKSACETSCESCEFYDYDYELDCYTCIMSLDEDEYADFLQSNTYSCPYYRFYDEYKSVQKQI